MSGGPKTTEQSKQQTAQDTSTNATTNVAGTNLVDSNTIGQSYNLGNSVTQNQQQTAGLTGSAGYTANNAWAPTEPILGNILTASADITKTPGLTNIESDAINALTDQAQRNATLNPQIENATSYMLSGGGFGEGDQYVKEGYDTAKAALDPYARGDYVDFNNPQLQGMLSTIRDDISNQIGGEFANAGRSFSGAHANTEARALAAGMAPTMLNWYTGQQDRQIAAANSRANQGNAASQALGANRAGSLSAMQGAPSLLKATYDPATTMLQGAELGRNIPIDTLGKVSNIVMPMAQAFGDQTTLGSGYNSSNTSGTSATTSENYGLTNEQQQQLTQNNLITMLESLGKSSGKTSGTTTTQQQVDPLMMLLGAGTMLGSSYLGRG